MAIRTSQFSGMLPRLDTRLLPLNGASEAQNVVLTSGTFEPIYEASRIQTFSDTDPVQTIYRMYSGNTDYWLRWTSDVNVAKSPVAGDTTFRIGFTSSDFEPRVTNLALATASTPYPNGWYVLGVSPPTAAPLVTSTGGSGAQETRAYIYTFVTQDGEESAPSPASNVLTGYVTDAWTLASLQAAPSNSYTISNVTWSGGQLRLTVDTTFGLRAGEYVTLSGLQTGLNNSYAVAEVTSPTEFRITMADPTVTDTTGTATRDAPHNTTNMLQRFYRTVTTDTGTDFYFVGERSAGSGSAVDDNTIPTTNRARTSNVATLTFASVPINFYVGQTVTVSGVGGSGYNGVFVLTAVTGATISYQCFAANEGSTVDTGGTVVAALGEPCPTIGWDMPPADLQGLALHPSGAWVGFSGNELCFSEPLATYAWPAAYRVTVDYPIVGIGVFGQSVAVGTQGTPYLVSGVSPESMAPQRIDEPWPCLAKRGMVTTMGGVAYPTTQGLAVIGLGGPQLVTKAAYTYKEWMPLQPSTFVAAFYANRYYTYYETTAGTDGMLIIDFAENLPVTTGTKLPTAMYTDSATGRLYFVEGNALFEWEADTGRRMGSVWRSRTYVAPPPLSLGAAKIDCSFAMTAEQVAAAQAAAAGVVTANQTLIDDMGTYGYFHVRAGTGDAALGAIGAHPVGSVAVGGSRLAKLPSTGWEEVYFTLFRNGAAAYTVRVTSSDVFRLPAIGKYDNFAWSVSSNIAISAVLIGDTPLSLRAA